MKSYKVFNYCFLDLVPGPGLEPGQDFSHKILSLARLPNSATPAWERDAAEYSNGSAGHVYTLPVARFQGDYGRTQRNGRILLPLRAWRLVERPTVCQAAFFSGSLSASSSALRGGVNPGEEPALKPWRKACPEAFAKSLL